MIRYCQLTLYVYLLSCIEHLISICNVDVLVNDCRLVRCSAWTSTLMGGSNYPLWTARRRVGNFGAVTLLSMIPLSLALLLLAVLTWWLLLNNIKKIQFSTLFSNPFFGWRESFPYLPQRAILKVAVSPIVPGMHRGRKKGLTFSIWLDLFPIWHVFNY